ncbi:uroporphyrinogen-III C-methyltransferase [Congregibacter brevis]|uniref:Uroporphyrinogen-III C-methyltransferase n=1 Tax=Congregibacter brevis TaxID=3081201 RepID=A0ABZ0IEA9_9GAMM|nr:uroporphyrinogen-III C-methyltransferase [Congregibacter sp. IMCC45268]
MSDEKNQDEERSESVAGGADVAGSESMPTGNDDHASPVSPAAQTPVQPAPAAASAPVQASETTGSQRSGATPIAWLALLLVIVMAVGVFYLFTDIQRREALLLQRVQGLESVSGQDVTTFDQMRDNLQRKIELEIEGMQASQQRAEEDLRRALEVQQRTLDTQQSQVSRLESTANEAAGSVKRVVEEQLGNLERSLREQQQLISDLTVEDRESWQIAEVQYLLRLANQRLIMTGDNVSAEALLRSADNILRGLDDTNLHDLRSAVASDIAALQAVPKLDVQGLYLRLDALIRQTDALVLFELPDQRVEIEPVTAEDWQTRLSEGYEMALNKLSEYIVVSRRDVPVETLMDPQYEGLVRQNMRMLLEQAQVAMLSGNELLFRQSLERAEGWVTQFFKADEQSAVAMASELQRIRDERVSVTLPDLSASLNALDTVMQARLARGGN